MLTCAHHIDEWDWGKWTLIILFWFRKSCWDHCLCFGYFSSSFIKHSAYPRKSTASPPPTRFSVFSIFTFTKHVKCSLSGMWTSWWSSFTNWLKVCTGWSVLFFGAWGVYVCSDVTPWSTPSFWTRWCTLSLLCSEKEVEEV